VSPRGRVRLRATPTNGKLNDHVMLGGLGVSDMEWSGAAVGANSLCNIGIVTISNPLSPKSSAHSLTTLMVAVSNLACKPAACGRVHHMAPGSLDGCRCLPHH
jgi:hypothetical protein